MTDKTTAIRIADDNRGINAFSSQSNFATAERMADAIAASTLVPDQYRRNIPNVLIALELASRIGASPFMVMQNMDVIHGRPSMRASFLIATVNACGRFTPLRFRWEGEPARGCPGSACRAYATEIESGDECVGVAITWDMAEAEGWTSKRGSKWKTMPELMFNYRAAAFWQRVYAPELSLGMHTREEIVDASEVSVGATTATAPARASGAASMAARAFASDPAIQAEPQPIEAEVVDDKPTCTGRAAGLAQSNSWRRDLYAELLGKEPGAVWASCCKRVGIEGSPTPAQLTVEHGLAVRDLIKPAIEAVIGERALEVLESEAKRKNGGSPTAELRGYVTGTTKDARRWTALDDNERETVLDAIRADASMGGDDAEQA